jgi:hypothetical protein
VNCSVDESTTRLCPLAWVALTVPRSVIFAVLPFAVTTKSCSGMRTVASLFTVTAPALRLIWGRASSKPGTLMKP